MSQQISISDSDNSSSGQSPDILEQKKGLSISTYFSICFALTFIVASVFFIAVINKMMHDEALSEADERAHILLQRNLATHRYFSHDLKPKLFESIAKTESKDYFEPAWMSSTYAIRQIDKYFNSFDGQGDYYYKECAIDARSEENEADPFEKVFIEKLNKDPDLQSVSREREIAGQWYFETLHRGETMEQSCLKCHSTPGNAPADMIARYGPKRSFGRNAGDVVSAVSIRIPLAKAYAANRETTIKLSILLSSLLGAILLGQFFFTKKILLKPIGLIRKKSRQIAFDSEHLGEKIDLPLGKELAGLVTAFNNMSAKLRDSRDSLEEKILERTSELQHQQQFLTSAIESLNHPFYAVDAEDYTVLLSNSTAKQGILDKNITCYEITHKLDRACGGSDHICPIEQVKKTGKPAIVEHEHIDANGQQVIVEVHAYPVFDKHGKVTQVIQYSLDITERKRSEEALKANKYFLEKAQEIGNIGTWKLDIKTGRLDWTDECYRIFGVAKETPLSYEFFISCVHPDDREDLDARWNAALKGTPYDVDHRIIVDGNVKWVRQKADLQFEGNGKCIGATGFAQDITEIRLAKDRELNHQVELAHASRLSIMGQMTTELAHELNQPLHAILANAEGSLRAAKLMPSEKNKVTERIETVIKQADRAGKIIARIRAFAAKGMPERKEVQLNEVVTDAMEFVNAELKRCNIKAVIQLQENAPLVNADHIQIEQVIINLIQNSIDSMNNIESGKRILTIKTQVVADSLEVSIKDTGCGIDIENQHDIFDPFVTSKEQGLGIGLSISRSIIDSHGGKLSFRDNTKEGVTLFFSIPVNL